MASRASQLVSAHESHANAWLKASFIFRPSGVGAAFVGLLSGFISCPNHHVGCASGSSRVSLFQAKRAASQKVAKCSGPASPLPQSGQGLKAPRVGVGLPGKVKTSISRSVSSRSRSTSTLVRAWGVRSVWTLPAKAPAQHRSHHPTLSCSARCVVHLDSHLVLRGPALLQPQQTSLDVGSASSLLRMRTVPRRPSQYMRMMVQACAQLTQ